MQTVNQDLVNLINEELKKWGVEEPIEIDPGAEEAILEVLQRDDVDKVYVDRDGGLVVEYLEEDPDGLEIKDNLVEGTLRS